jgi:hypothetical protein
LFVVVVVAVCCLASLCLRRFCFIVGLFLARPWRFAAAATTAAAHVLRTWLPGGFPQEAQELITVTYFQPLFFLRTSNQLILFWLFPHYAKPKVLVRKVQKTRDYFTRLLTQIVLVLVVLGVFVGVLLLLRVIISLSDDYDKSVIIMSSAGGNESLDFRFSRLGCMIR